MFSKAVPGGVEGDAGLPEEIWRQLLEKHPSSFLNQHIKRRKKQNNAFQSLMQINFVLFGEGSKSEKLKVCDMN